jgi:ketosteroid isomerase-like protein
MAQGREAIADSWRSTMMELKNFHLEFAPTKIEVASSGDLAYEMRFILWLTDARMTSRSATTANTLWSGKKPMGIGRRLRISSTTDQ